MFYILGVTKYCYLSLGAMLVSLINVEVNFPNSTNPCVEFIKLSLVEKWY